MDVIGAALLVASGRNQCQTRLLLNPDLFRDGMLNPDLAQPFRDGMLNPDLAQPNPG